MEGVTMGKIFLIAKKDFQSYFHSPIAYIIISVFLFLIGFIFFNLLSHFQQSQLQFMQVSQGPKPTISENIITPMFGNINVILLFVVPFITMRLISEERKEQTLTLLMAAPIRSIDIILGKFLAGVGLVSVMLAGTLIYPIILFFGSSPDVGVLLGNYLGMLLVICTYIAIGLFWSSCTENQIISAVMTFGALLFFWLVGLLGTQSGSVWGELFDHLSIITHFLNFSQGILTIGDMVYYLSFTCFALFGAYTVFDIERSVE